VKVSTFSTGVLFIAILVMISCVAMTFVLCTFHSRTFDLLGPAGRLTPVGQTSAVSIGTTSSAYLKFVLTLCLPCVALP